MKKILYILITIYIFESRTSFAQNERPTWYANVNLNTYLPSQSVKGAAFGVGNLGLGLGASRVQPIKNNLFLKYQGNVSFNSYTDHVASFTNPSGQSLGGTLPSTVDFVLNLTTIVNYSLGKNFSLGTGFGFRTLLHSASKYDTSPFKIETVNAHYKRIMPVLPIEMSLKINKVMLNMRYEYSILNKVRGDLSDFVTERYGIVSLEVGYKIK